jgi:hypothetical protein
MHLQPIKSIVSSRPDRFQLSKTLVQCWNARRFAEVGVWRGEFAEQLLAECPSIEQYFLIDPWRKLDAWDKPFNVPDEAFVKVYDEAVRRTEPYAGKRVVLRGTTAEVAGEIDDASIDIAYIDGDHTLRGIIVDLVNIFPKIRSGGLVIGDDCVADIFQHGLDYEPTLVFQGAVAFAEAVGAPFFVSSSMQFVMVKPNPGERNFLVFDLDGRFANPALKPQLSPGKLLKRWLKTHLQSVVRRYL